jgi:hypothetical protein
MSARSFLGVILSVTWACGPPLGMKKNVRLSSFNLSLRMTDKNYLPSSMQTPNDNIIAWGELGMRS